MTSARHIVALLQSHFDGNDEQFLTIAMQAAAHEARQGHGKLAQQLRELVDAARERNKAPLRGREPVPLAQPRGDLANLVAVRYSETRLTSMVLGPPLEQRLRRILHEQRQQHRLLVHGLQPRRKLLLLGPPGAGKTMTAAALAGELHMPLFTIQLDALMTKFMGETAGKLRLVFDAIVETRGVYFFDEFDAIGACRNAQNDVGEVRRILNSFLQFLEEDDSESLIIAATNHPELLDPALFRRFDDVIEYALPDSEIAARILENGCHLLRLLVSTGRLQWRLELASVKRSLLEQRRMPPNTSYLTIVKQSLPRIWPMPSPSAKRQLGAKL